MDIKKEEEKIVIKKRQFVTQKTTETIAENYEAKETLGKGRFSEVIKAVNKNTGKVVAIKIVKKWNVEYSEYVRREIQYLSEMDHPYIARLYEWSEDKDNFFLVSEFCAGGELLERIKKLKIFTENHAAVIFKNLLLGLNYCHIRGIAHRDLKPENCMFESSDKSATLKLIDFGFAKIFTDSLAGKIPLDKAVGTPYYMAPEVFTGKYDEKCDIWSAGVILFQTVVGNLPFGGKEKKDIFANIKRGFRGFPKSSSLSLRCKDLILSLLSLDPEKRPSAAVALRHPWLKIIDSSEKILTIPSCVLNNIRIYQGLEKLKKAVISCVASKLTNNEGEELKNLFLELDTNGDGKISEEELEQYAEQFRNKEELKKLMKTMDLDNDGFIEYNEFLAAALPASSYLSHEKLKEAFNIFDNNLDQKLSVAEIQNLIDSDKLLPTAYWDDLMAKYDLNKDGFIDFEEFLDMMHMKEWEFVINEQ